jgi:hypothetical protein
MTALTPAYTMQSAQRSFDGKCPTCGAAALLTALNLTAEEIHIEQALCRDCITAAVEDVLPWPQSEEALTYFRTFLWGDPKPMTYDERNALVNSLAPEQLAPKAQKEDQTFRYALLLLLADIAGNQQTAAYSYRELLKLQQAKTPKGPVAVGGKAPR